MTRAGVERNLRAVVERAAQHAASSGRPQWVVLRRDAGGRGAFDLFRDAGAEAERFFWAREGREVAASGALLSIETRGAERFAAAAARCRALREDIHLVGEDAQAEIDPLLVGGFGFADEAEASGIWNRFPALSLVLPEVLVTRNGERSLLTTVRRIAANEDIDVACEGLLADPTAARRGRNSLDATLATRATERADGTEDPEVAYRAQIEAALAAVNAGDLEKVVIARAVHLHSEERFATEAILAHLRRSYPACTTFAVTRGRDTFLGASPERLLRIEAGRVEATALAGSAPRGDTPEEDARLARQLLESKKEQEEHAVVVRALREALEPTCSELDVPEAPRVARFEGIQHLETPLAGELAHNSTGASVLELAARLHPSPAVAGAPRAAALAWLERNEPLERGWYAGGVGFVTPSGDGELSVALRCALVRETEASLFAGAGIVAGSQPDAELAETRLKLQALLARMLGD